MHSCPECAQACDCGGDIDDMLCESVACEHECGPEDDDREDLGILGLPGYEEDDESAQQGD